MKTTILAVLLLVSFSFPSVGQSDGTIRGQVRDASGQPVLFATIALLNARDSSLVKATATDQTGAFVVTNLSYGSYRVGVSAVGFEAQAGAKVSLPDAQPIVLEPVTLRESMKKLAAVTVTARKPLVEVLPDKLVFNVGSSLNAVGSTAFELLQKSPGVVVDRSDNILLQGSTGVRVYINGKPSPLGAAELAAYLRSLPATDIEAIEVITQPSARYDAAGGAGILNIRLKKDSRFGTNASLTLGLAMGRYYPKGTGSLTVNHRQGKLNAFGTYSNRLARDWSFINLYREQLGTVYDQRSESRSRTSSHNVHTGADLFLTSFSTLGILLDANLTDRQSATLGRTPIGPAGQPAVRLLTADNSSLSGRQNLNTNLNYRFADTTGHLLNIDADYGRYQTSSDQYQPNRYTSLPAGAATPGTLLSERNYRMQTGTNIRLGTFKADYEQRVGGGKLSAGMKYSDVQTDNAFRFFNVNDGVDQPDAARTNQFAYTERISAGYVSYDRRQGKWQYQAGVRLEETRSLGTLTSAVQQADAQVSRQYLNAFPSAGLTYAFNATNSLGLTYSRRIDRPTYANLNPFESKTDELTYQKGNAFLKPQYTDNMQLAYTRNYTLNVSLGYSRTIDYFTEITDTTETNRNYITTRNLGERTALTLAVSYPFQVAKWWNVYANVSAYRSATRANLGPGRDINLVANVVSIYAQQTFTLPGKFTAELSGFYNSPSIWGGTFINRRFWGVDAGVQRKVLADRATLKLTISDVFQSMQWRGISQFGGLYMDASGGWESRQLRLNLSWNLGSRTVKSARSRQTGAEAEADRVR
ncbi:TonB-dependent receptor [Fibrivirga algicola]|uniref:TonB-dependent receptor n=1 Tax=Fibrivirga algicola TaxID=2950420 RepID=A0ABX0QIF5_9BACT|nr:TonB-dependent receptor [Fibrivirga algicola]NID10727.1 TonB-dependent receptor [Fibrivirga algicola]